MRYVLLTCTVLFFTAAHGDQQHELEKPDTDRERDYGITKYQVKIFASTDQLLLQDCVEQNEETDGFHLGRIKGTNKIIMYCGHKPDKIGEYVTYTAKEGI